MQDVIGLGKSVDKLLDIIARGTGILYEPVRARKAADSEAYRLKVVSEAKLETKQLVVKSNLENKRLAKVAKQSLKGRAKQRKQYKKLQKQKNLDSIFNLAVLAPPSQFPDEQVSSDWFDSFIDFAETISSEMMQDAWAKVFVKEVEFPGTFSIKSLEFLKKMTPHDAKLFASLCRYAGRKSNNEMVVVNGARKGGLLEYFWYPDASKNFFPYKSELDLIDFMALQQLGLIYEDELVWRKLPKGKKIELTNGQQKISLTTKKRNVCISIFSLTPLACELAELVNYGFKEDYFHLLQNEVKSCLVISFSE